jgi:hypothetical protein
MRCWDKIKSWCCRGTTKTKAEEPVAKETPPAEPADTENPDTK